MFSKKDLTKLILPLVVEQILAVTIGMADTIMVSSVGEAAVSGLSLVDAINVLLINIFAALATGGAVVASQYIGYKDRDHACLSAKQLILSTGILAIFIMIFSLLFNQGILRLIFGNVESAVMSNARIYFYLSACSYPFIALYNAGAALFRSMGNSQISMKTSLIMNGLNITGNAILIYGFGLGVAGAALSSLFSRIVGALIILFLLRNKENAIYIDDYKKCGLRFDVIKKILTIGVPTGLENGLFQVGKICLQGLIASFGTVSIAANAVANNIATLEIIPGMAIGLGMVTVVGQCVGAGQYEEAKGYMIKLTKAAYASMIALNILVLLCSKWILKIYSLSADTLDLAFILLLIHGIGAMIIWPPSFTLPNGLRAANDARYTMAISIASMWIFRIIFGIILGKYLGLGAIGVWLAMVGDWVCRSICFLTRLQNGKWRNRRLV